MRKRIRFKRLAAACAALALTACFSACSAMDVMDAVFGRFSPLASESTSGAMEETDTLPDDADSLEGLVLDASGGLLVLRTAEGLEYVFRMEGAADRVEGGTAAGQYVRVWFSGTLEDTNARNVKLLRIEAARETKLDTYDRNSVAEGYVVSFTEERITIRTAHGEEYTFTAGPGVRALQTELREGQWVRVTFDGTPDACVVSKVTESARAADVFTVTGVLKNFSEEDDSVTFQADSGGYYTFQLGDAEIIAPDGGLWAEERRFVFTYRGFAAPQETEHALLLRICAEKKAETQRIQGIVCGVDEKRGLIDVCAANGRVLTFSTGTSLLKAEDGPKPGSGVTIAYSGCISGEYLHEVEIVSISVRGAGFESSLLGTVRSVTENTLVVEAADGRTLRFSRPEDALFSERMQRGDTVRVTYKGWIEAEDTSNAVFVCATRAYD